MRSSPLCFGPRDDEIPKCPFCGAPYYGCKETDFRGRCAKDPQAGKPIPRD